MKNVYLYQYLDVSSCYLLTINFMTMKLLLISAIVFLSTQATVAVFENETLGMIACANETFTYGLPEAGIPTHYPYVAIQNFSHEFSIGILKLRLSAVNWNWSGLIFWNHPEVKGTEGDNSEWVIIEWIMHWPKFVISGNFDWDLSLGTTDQRLLGGSSNLSIILTGNKWWGMWNQSLIRSIHEVPKIYAMTFHTKVEQIKVSVSGLGLINDIVQLCMQIFNDYLWNNMPSFIGNLLTIRVNDNFVAHPDRLRAVLENCKNHNQSGFDFRLDTLE